MWRAGLLIIGLIVFCGATPGPTAFAGNNSWPDQNMVSSEPLQPGVGKHQTHAGSQSTIEFPNANEVTSRIETVSSAPPTRTSFMATWDGTSGAEGYLLDVSTSDS